MSEFTNILLCYEEEKNRVYQSSYQIMIVIKL